MRLITRKIHSTADAENRRGTALVETAVVLPIFFLLLFAFIEFGHCFMTIHTMNSAARRAARLGVGDGSTTADVKKTAKDILGAAINADLDDVKIWVKDGSSFDDVALDAGDISYDDLPDVNIEDLEPRSLFLVRVQVPYHQIGILGPRWVRGLNLYGQSVMRKE
ncbi:TadE/TadG family type IV pilus assembly protein [Fuerstiella marisgermanici]|uniref:Flp pilus assembly protein n=1 Tax=Fuerstiella marisgermanici TaxID=1891926 RepID=A0A1P8WHU5_9PLAN|nr:TadE/TadG family type IV pilus assembly protein [Fuerstiella marisgermanici]APZ93603.1 Flp pilus assembly protein [Fuerstiella marisgermanici]